MISCFQRLYCTTRRAVLNYIIIILGCVGPKISKSDFNISAHSKMYLNEHSLEIFNHVYMSKRHQLLNSRRPNQLDDGRGHLTYQAAHMATTRSRILFGYHQVSFQATRRTRIFTRRLGAPGCSPGDQKNCSMKIVILEFP